MRVERERGDDSVAGYSSVKPASHTWMVSSTFPIGVCVCEH